MTQVYVHILCRRHDIDTLPTLLALFVGNPPVTAVFQLKKPAIQSSDIFFLVSIDKLLNNQSTRH